MAYDFSAKDIFEMAEQIERNGATFYRSAANSVSDQKSKDFLLKLAEMEVQHEKTFQALKATLTDAEKTSTVFDPHGEAESYLKALADTRVFFEKKIDLSSLKEIFKAAIEAEKDSIVFYLGMREFVPEKSGKDKVNAIIKEEMSHITILSKELMALKK